jgi:hypothetical protein
VRLAQKKEFIHDCQLSGREGLEVRRVHYWKPLHSTEISVFDWIDVKRVLWVNQ